MDLFDIKAHQKFIPEIKILMEYYDYKHNIAETNDEIIRRTKKDGTDNKYTTIEEFICKEIFYKTKINLHFFPQDNPTNGVCNFDIGPMDIVKNNPILSHLLSHPIFTKFLVDAHNFGTFLRFAENKVQRLYWNLAMNGGMPLSGKKDKDAVSELIFLMHDIGHLLLVDLVPTGNCSDVHKKIYVYWRLLGESITIVLNEMLVVDYLKNLPEFSQMLKLGLSSCKPYSLYKILKPISLNDPIALKNLFHASYMYFCLLEPNELIALIDKENHPNWESIWTEFNVRYYPVAARGREWTESNYENISKISDDYKKWYKTIEPAKEYLQFRTIDDHINYVNKNDLSDDDITIDLFWFVWFDLLFPLFFGSQTSDPIGLTKRKIKSFVRYMVGNIFILVKYENELGIDCNEMVERLLNIDPKNMNNEMNDITDLYRSYITKLYEMNIISANEYHNYKNIFIMIPPNILKKDAY